LTRTPLSVHLILFAGTVCFASLPVAGRLALGHVSPGAIPLVRTAGGAIVFALIAWRRGTLRLARGDVGFMVLCTVLGTVLNQELFIHGLARSTATNAIVVGSTIPVFAALVAIALGREPVRVRRLIGMAIAFGGVAALVGIERVSTSPEHLLGSVLVLLNAASYATYLVIGRPLAERYDPFALLAFMFLVALPMVAPFGIHALAADDAPVLVGRDYAFLAFLVAVPTVGAYSLIQTGLRHAESTLVASYVYLQPLFASLGAALVLDEQLDLRTVACGAVVLFGVWLAARSRP
jgi:drug/metabolite transporter (DMT)-like permease